MFQVGEKVHWYNDSNLVGTVLESDQTTSVVDWGIYGIMKNDNVRLRRVGVKEITITITLESPVKHAWKDTPDQSTYANIRPGVNAAVMYAADGSSWEWAVSSSKNDVYGQGRSIDRRTAKSDAEFFIANYQPEDTSERDELRRKLEKSWSK